MRRNRIGQRMQVIAALQHRYQPPVAMFIGQIAQFSGNPCVIALDQLQIGQRVVAMRVKSGRDQNQVGVKGGNGRKDLHGHFLAEHRAAAARIQRYIHHIAMRAGFIGRTAARIEWHFVGRGKEYPRIVPDQILRAVAMMHVEIDDGHAVNPGQGQGMFGGDCHIAKQAKPHGFLLFRVMARRADGAKGVVGLPLHHHIHRPDHRTNSAIGRRQRPRRFMGIRVQRSLGRGADCIDMGLRVGQQDMRIRAHGRIYAQQVVFSQRDIYRDQALYRFGMAGRVDMGQAVRVAQESGCHRGNPRQYSRHSQGGFMRALVFFLLFPVWAAAQPAMIDPAQVVGFARTDLNEDGYDERFVLVLDGEGGVDLFIFHEITGAAPVFVDNFIETTREAPLIEAVGPDAVVISLRSTDAYGSHIREQYIGWDWDNGGYIVVGLGVKSEPRTVDGASFECGIDLLVGGMRIVRGDAVINKEISAPPEPVQSPNTGAALALCYDE